MSFVEGTATVLTRAGIIHRTAFKMNFVLITMRSDVFISMTKNLATTDCLNAPNTSSTYFEVIT